MKRSVISPEPSGTAIPKLLLISGCLIAMLTFGARSSMGFFQLPMLDTMNWDRSTFAMAMAIQNLLWGIGQPVFGVIADRFGTWRVLLFSGICYASGLYLMASASSASALYIGGGVLVGLGIASGSFTIIMSAFARNVPAQKRTFVFGIATAAGSAGMALFSPLSVALITSLGWQDTLVWFSFAMLLIPLLGIPLVGNGQTARFAQKEVEQTVRQALSQAFSHKSYLLLVTGFFVCGFHLAFITAHFPAYISDIGIEAKWAGMALLLIGLFNIAGSLGSGIISSRYSMSRFLVWIYLARAVAIAAFITLPPSPTTIVIFAAVMGLLWLSTVPPTNGLVALMFGTKYLGMLGGIVFFSHQVGSFLGVWLGGYLYDQLGSYDPVWWLGVVLAIFAAIVHWPISAASVAPES